MIGWCNRRMARITSSSTPSTAIRMTVASAHEHAVPPRPICGRPRREAAPCSGEYHDTHVVVVGKIGEVSRNGSMTSNDMEFMRSGRFSVTKTTLGLGRSTSTKLTLARYR